MNCLGLILLATGAVAQAAPGGSAPRPHIVYILADDLGWKDVGFQGGDIKTPNLDRLAGDGVRFRQFYVQPVCSPTRACLMTGRYCMRQGLQFVIRPFMNYGLPLEERTLPEALKSAGYRTAMIGKWHLGFTDPAWRPLRRGFGYHYGFYVGSIDYWTHERDGGLDWRRNDQPLREEGYSTQLLAADAVRLIEKHDPAQPLFLYLAFNAVHAPLQAPEEYVNRYAHIKDKSRRTYAAMTTCMDNAIGRVVEALERHGMRENTLILFSSDNGGAEAKGGADNGELRGMKATLYEGGIRVPAFATWPKRLRRGVVEPAVHVIDWYPTLLKLAGASLEQKLPLDGSDIWPTITEGRPSPHAEIVHELDTTSGAIRRGDWKLILTGGEIFSGAGEITAPKVELFNIAQDPTESKDLAASQPERVKELARRLASYRSGMIPSKTKGDRAPAGFKVPPVWGE